MSLLNELKRRDVLRVGAAYIVSGWLVIQVVETIFPAFGFSDAAIRIVVITFAIGLIPALIFSWAYEITPEGLRKEKDVEPLASVTHNTGKKLDRVIMIVLALALGYFAFDKFGLSQSREASIAESARQQRFDSLNGFRHRQLGKDMTQISIRFQAGGLYLYFGLDAQVAFRTHAGHEQFTAFV